MNQPGDTNEYPLPSYKSFGGSIGIISGPIIFEHTSVDTIREIIQEEYVDYGLSGARLDFYIRQIMIKYHSDDPIHIRLSSLYPINDIGETYGKLLYILSL